MNSLELIEAIRSGRDPRAAEEELYLQVRTALLGRLEQMISGPVRARLDPEDVLHEAFLKAIAALGTFRPVNEHSFAAWVYRIAKNVILNTAARRSARAARLVRGEDHGPRASQVPEHGPRASSAFRENEWIEWALAQLQPKEREVIRLHDIAGRSHEEIAGDWGSSYEAVKKLHWRAVRKFRAIADREEKGKPAPDPE